MRAQVKMYSILADRPVSSVFEIFELDITVNSEPIIRAMWSGKSNKSPDLILIFLLYSRVFRFRPSFLVVYMPDLN